MDLTQLVNLGEFIGGVAVLVTLIYLAAQVRNSAREQRAASMAQATHELAVVVDAASGSRERAEIFLRALEDFDRLERVERLQFSGFMVHYLRVVEHLCYQHRDGRVESTV